MHTTPSGRGPRVPTAAAKAKAGQRLAEHIDRKFSSVEIPKPAVAGAPLGVASVAVTAASIILAHQGDGTVDEGLYEFGSPYDPNAGRGSYSGIPVGEIITGPNGYGGLLVSEGWYWLSAVVDLGWSTPANAPDVWYGFMGGGASPSMNYDEAFNTVTLSGRRGLSRVVHSKEPVWIAAGDDVNLAVNYPACGAPVDRGLFGTSPSIVFTVTKWT